MRFLTSELVPFGQRKVTPAIYDGESDGLLVPNFKLRITVELDREEFSVVKSLSVDQLFTNIEAPGGREAKFDAKKRTVTIEITYKGRVRPLELPNPGVVLSHAATVERRLHTNLTGALQAS